MDNDATSREVGSTEELGLLTSPLSYEVRITNRLAQWRGSKAIRDAAHIARDADEDILRLRKAWGYTLTQRDELLAHIAGKAPLPQWATDLLKA